MRTGEHSSRQQLGGFTYLWLLAAIAVLAIGMSLVGPMWAEQVQRQREAELLRVGTAYAQAIEHYYRMQPSGMQQLPRSVDDLLLDPRFTQPVRHLRQAYTDPLLPGQPMQLVRGLAGDLRGVTSSSDAKPLMRAPWTDGRHALPAATPETRYRDWQFLADTSS
ncbi:MAG: type II secretion system protein [Pseudomonadota bacterium]|nr:type II secretion system protein [Pseudomonadota bacterium]